jgi:hypothetical protein
MIKTASKRPIDDWQYRDLISLAQRAGIPHAKLEPVLEELWPVYFRYDAKAARAQHRFCRGAVAVYCLSGVAVAVAIGQLLFMPAIHQVVALEVLAMVAALLLLVLSHRRQWKRDWLSNRYAAEQLRMRMYLAVVPRQDDGSPDSGHGMDPSTTLPFYNQLGATLSSDAEAAMRAKGLAGCAVDDVGMLKKWLGEGWIASQARFHRGAAVRHQRSTRRARRITVALFGMTLVAATLHALGVGHSESSGGHMQNSLTASLILFFSITLPVMASAVHAINDLLDHDRITVRSSSMAELLDRLAREVGEARTLEQIRDLAGRTEQVMTMENFEWLAALTFRQQPHAPV